MGSSTGSNVRTGVAQLECARYATAGWCVACRHGCAVSERYTSCVRISTVVDCSNTSHVAQDSFLISANAKDVEVKAVWSVDVLGLTSRSGTGVEESIGQLSVVTKCDVFGCTIWTNEIEDSNVLRVGIDDPLVEAEGLIRLADHDARVWSERIGTHSVNNPGNVRNVLSVL